MFAQSVAKIVSAGQAPGIAVVASLKGRRFAEYTGKASLENNLDICDRTRFEISCLAKLLISLIVLRHVETGRLDLTHR